MSDATIWQDNARRFASRADDAIHQHRHAGVRESLQLIATGRRDDAHEELARSVSAAAVEARLGDRPGRGLLVPDRPRGPRRGRDRHKVDLIQGPKGAVMTSAHPDENEPGDEVRRG